MRDVSNIMGWLHHVCDDLNNGIVNAISVRERRSGFLQNLSSPRWLTEGSLEMLVDYLIDRKIAAINLPRKRG
jgi:hypothetical protein